VFYDTWPGNEVGLFYNAPEPGHTGPVLSLKTSGT